MVCKKCGKNIKSDRTVCPRCGTIVADRVSLGSVSAQTNGKPNKPKKKASGSDIALWVILSLVSLLAILGILFGAFYMIGLNYVENNAHIDEKFTEP